MQQFSRNIRPGFYNIKTTANLPEPSDTTSGIFKTAFLNPADQSVVLFVGNTSAEQRTVKIVDGTKGFTTVLQANSLTTFKYDVSAFECTGQPGTFTAQSSSDQSSSQTAAMAIDQDSETRWASSWNDSEWLKLDMGTQTRISGVAIDWECGYDSAYEVQTSVDGLTWTTVRAIPLNTTTSRKAELNFSPITARYLKIQGIQRNNSYGYSIYEIVPITAR
jgi:uncharacterized protein (DUF2235 family)